MKRRSFIQSLLAVPVVAAASRLLPARAESIQQSAPSATSILTLEPKSSYAWYEAGEPIRRGTLLRFHQFLSKTVVPLDCVGGGNFAGVAINDVMKGDSVCVGTEGTFPVRFK